MLDISTLHDETGNYSNSRLLYTNLYKLVQISVRNEIPTELHLNLKFDIIKLIYEDEMIYGIKRSKNL